MKEFFNNLKFSWSYVKSYKKEMIGYILLSFLSVIVSIIIPILSARNIVSLTNSDFEQLLFISLILLVVNILQYIITYFVRYFTQIVYRETFKNIQRDLGKEILKLENKYVIVMGSDEFMRKINIAKTSTFITC